MGANWSGSPAGPFSSMFRIAPVAAGQTTLVTAPAGLSIYLQTISIANITGGAIEYIFGINGGGGPFFGEIVVPANNGSQLTFPGGLKLGNNLFIVITSAGGSNIAGSYATGPIV